MNKLKLALVPLFTILSVNAYSQLFYKIVSPKKGRVSYLFGTIHGSSKLIGIPNLVTQHLEQSKVLYLEVLETISKSDYADTLAKSYSVYPSGSTIKNYLTESEYNQLKVAFIQTGQISDSVFDNELSGYTPYVLDGIYLKLRQKHPIFEGLDFKLERFARVKKLKFIRTFETPEQLAYFHGLTAKEKSPSFFVHNLDSLYNNHSKIENAYLKQDTSLITKLTNDTIVCYRNVQWMEILAPKLEKASTFIAVGAAHLTGPRGLVALFKENGYNVEAIPIYFMTASPILKSEKSSQ